MLVFGGVAKLVVVDPPAGEVGLLAGGRGLAGFELLVTSSSMNAGSTTQMPAALPQLASAVLNPDRPARRRGTATARSPHRRIARAPAVTLKDECDPAIRAPCRRIVDNREVSTADVHEEEVESRYEATFGVLLVIGLQATLAGVSLGAGWTLIGLPGWVWLIPVVPEAALLLVLSWSLPRHRLEQMGRRRTVALVLVGVITVADAFALVALIASLLGGHEKSGGELLLKGGTIWGTNMITFGAGQA